MRVEDENKIHIEEKTQASPQWGIKMKSLSFADYIEHVATMISLTTLLFLQT